MFSNKKYDRRTMLKGAAALGIASTFSALPTELFAKNKIELGTKKISVLSDGNLNLPVNFLFPDLPKNVIEAYLTKNNMSTKALQPECNMTLIEDGERLILVDAGAGANFMPSAGKIAESMSDAGISAEAITDVIFTHGHPDHLWGIVDDFDEIAFPEANLHFPQIEWDFWNKDGVEKSMSEGREVFAIGAKNRMNVMKDRVQLFKAGAEVLPGIEAIDTAGHTPGHISFALHSGSESVIVIGDAITNHAVSFEKPEWPSGSDQDPQLGIQTRKKLLDRLAADKSQIIGYHLPNGGIGTVENNHGAYKFIQQV